MTPQYEHHCRACDDTTTHLLIDDVLKCTLCPDPTGDEELTEDIYDAAYSKAINPHSGKLLTFDQIVVRNSQATIDRDAEKALGAEHGLEYGLPLDCPINPTFLRGTFKHWCDGWGFTFKDGSIISEQVDESKSASPCAYQPMPVGWYCWFGDEDKAGSGMENARYFKTLDAAWSAYVAWKAAELSVQGKTAEALKLYKDAAMKFAYGEGVYDLPPRCKLCNGRGEGCECSKPDHRQQYASKPEPGYCSLCGPLAPDGAPSISVTNVGSRAYYPCPVCDPCPEWWEVGGVEQLDVPVGHVYGELINGRSMRSTRHNTWWRYGSMLWRVWSRTKIQTFDYGDDGRVVVQWVSLRLPTDDEVKAASYRSTFPPEAGGIRPKVWHDDQQRWVSWSVGSRSRTSLVKWARANPWGVVSRAVAVATVTAVGWLVGAMLW